MITVPSSSDVQTVGVASVEFDTTLAADRAYVFAANTDCYVAQADTSATASAADGSVFVPAGTPLYLHGRNGDKVAVIQDASGGTASLAVATR